MNRDLVRSRLIFNGNHLKFKHTEFRVMDQSICLNNKTSLLPFCHGLYNNYMPPSLTLVDVRRDSSSDPRRILQVEVNQPQQPRNKHPKANVHAIERIGRSSLEDDARQDIVPGYHHKWRHSADDISYARTQVAHPCWEPRASWELQVADRLAQALSTLALFFRDTLTYSRRSLLSRKRWRDTS